MQAALVWGTPQVFFSLSQSRRWLPFLDQRMSFLRTYRARQLSVFVALFTAACADNSLPTSASSDLTRISTSAALTGAPKHLVYFTGNSVPSDFEATIASLGGHLEVAYEEVGIAVVEGLSPASVEQLSAASGIAAVDEEYSFKFLDDNAVPDATSVIASPTDPTKAAAYAAQWNMRAVGANVAWAAGHLGSPAVKVAILDTGIDYLHPDLVGRVDLANSASFIPSDDALVGMFFPGRHVSTDLHVHGTHVAATVASNSNLVAGVTTRTTLMSVKIIGVTGSGGTVPFLNGLLFATNRGANVINLSLGVRDLMSRKEKEVKAFERLVDRLFGYAHSKGVIIVAAAGNEAQNLDTKHSYKGYCSSSYVICVSATTSSSQLASYSNFGEKDVDIAAPGGTPTAPILGPCSTSTLLIPACQTNPTVIIGLIGTSQATPHVSAAAALVLAKSPKASPGAVEGALLGGATDIGPKGKDASFGRGLLNIPAALGL
jgi:lantibiotic leader peptide-processing serine protease